MKLIVFVKEDQKNLIINLVNFVCNNKYDIIFFTKFSNFIQFIYDCESKKLSENLENPENPLDEFFLIFADYSLFPMDCVNPYFILPRKELAFSLCLYNDPFPNPKERAAYWLSKNRFYYDNFISEEQFSRLAEIFEKLQCVLLLPNFSKKISVICDSYKFINNEFKTEVKNQFKLENLNYLKIENQNKLEKKFAVKSQNKIKVKSKSLKIIKLKCEKTLPSSRCRLLEYFLGHLDEEIKLQTLSNFMWGKSSQDKSKSIYAYINDLRRMLENVPNCEFKLLRTKKGFYKMQYNKN